MSRRNGDKTACRSEGPARVESQDLKAHDLTFTGMSEASKTLLPRGRGNVRTLATDLASDLKFGALPDGLVCGRDLDLVGCPTHASAGMACHKVLPQIPRTKS